MTPDTGRANRNADCLAKPMDPVWGLHHSERSCYGLPLQADSAGILWISFFWLASAGRPVSFSALP